MTEIIIPLASFVIALAIGILIGKLIASSNIKLQKASLEERLNGLHTQIDQLKIQNQQNSILAEKQLQQIILERENLRVEKEVLAIQLSKKKLILKIFGKGIKNRSKK